MKLASNFLFRLAPLCACATLASAQSGHSADRLIPGTLYETTTTTGTSVVTGPGMSTRTRTIEAPGMVRNEVLEVSGAALAAEGNPLKGKPGSYTLEVQGRFYGVDPIKREYYEMRVKDLIDKTAGMMKALEGMKTKVSEDKVDTEDLGEGEVILGHRTRHWRMRQSMTMTAQMMDDTIAISSEMIIDTHYARDLERLKSTSVKVDSLQLSAFRSFMPFGDMAKTVAAYSRLPKTIPLKSVQKGSFFMGPMDMSVTVTTAVTKIEKGKFSESLFRVPKGYKLVEMPFPKMPAMAPPEG